MGLNGDHFRARKPERRGDREAARPGAAVDDGVERSAARRQVEHAVHQPGRRERDAMDPAILRRIRLAVSLAQRVVRGGRIEQLNLLLKRHAHRDSCSSGLDGCAHRGDDRLVVLVPEDRAAGNEGVRSGIEGRTAKIYLSGTYQLNEKLKLGALFYNENGGLDVSYTGFAVNATYQLLKQIQLGGTLGLRNGSFSNLGMHFVAQLGPVQLFGVTDNIISAFRPYDSKNANGRLGINIQL